MQMIPDQLASRSPASTPAPGHTIRALRSCAATYETGGKLATADLLNEAADMIEAMTAMLADHRIGRPRL